jgi:hypothetical protein
MGRQMLNQHPKDLKPTRVSVRLPSLRYVWMGLLILTSADARTETIFRCGDNYSPSALCADGRSAVIQTPTETHVTLHDKTSTATRDQREADALEKARLSAEHRAMQNASAQIMGTYPNNAVSHTDVPAADVRQNGRYARRLHSPYFTAKDPNAPPKKKSSVKTLPPGGN